VTTSRFAAFAVPVFRRYFLAVVLSQVGSWFQTLTVTLVIAQRTGDPFALTGASIAIFGPSVLFFWLAGWLCDRVSPRRIAIGAMVANAAVAPALVGVFARPDLDLGATFALLAVGGTASTFYRIASQSLIYELVGPGLLQNAVVWASLVNSSARVVGPGLAGTAIAFAGESGALWFNLAFALLAVVSMATIRERDLVPRRAAPAAAATASATPRPPRRPRLPGSILVILVLNALVCGWSMNVPLTVTATVSIQFEGDAAALALAHSATAIGAVLTAPLVTRARAVTATIAVLGVIAFGVAQVATGAMPTLPWFLGMCVVFGVGLALFQSSVAAAIQTGSPPPVLGRAVSLLNLGNFGLLPLGAVLVGAWADAYGGTAAFAIGGAASIVAGLVALAALAILRRSAARNAGPEDAR